VSGDPLSAAPLNHGQLSIWNWASETRRLAFELAISLPLCALTSLMKA